jgi:hypothetical protein
MTTYSTNITLHDAFPRDYITLESELKRLSFAPAGKSVWKFKKADQPFEKAALFTCQANELLDVTGRILNAARKTGKVFSFTVIKSKT